MKPYDMIDIEGFTKKRQMDFFVGDMMFLGYKILPDKDNFSTLYSLFFFNNKLDSDQKIIVEYMFRLDTKEELNAFESHPYNLNNWKEEDLEKFVNPVLKEGVPGKTQYFTNFVFDRPLLPVNGESYKFECRHDDINTKTEVVRNVVCSRDVWLQLSYFIYWLRCLHPARPNMFNSPQWKNIDIVHATGILFDGTFSNTNSFEQFLMAHFTVYSSTITDRTSVGIIIPVLKEPGKIEKSNVDDVKEAYKDDVIIMPEDTFAILSPSKCYAFLRKNSAKGNYTVYTLDPELVKSSHWMDWGKIIYL